MAIDMNWNYVAGFFDGEGSVCIPNGAHHNPRVALYQTGERGRVVLASIQRFIYEEDRIESRLVPHERGGNRKIIWTLVVERRYEVQCFLAWILPYVRIKKVEVQDHLRYLKVFPAIPAHKFWITRRVA